MKILKKDLRQGLVKLQITNQEDLWYLSHIVEENDVIRGSTERKIKIGQEPNIKTVRKKVFLEIKTEKIEYEPEHNALRLLGTITSGPDDISLGSYHSFNLQERDEIEIQKDWASYQLDKLEEATKESKNILLVVFDREQAKLAELKKTGYTLLTEIKGDVQKKGFETDSNNFYKELSAVIEEYSKKYKKIIIASPAFWKEYLIKELTEETNKKVVQATISSVDNTSFKELLKRDELLRVLQDYRASEEEIIIEKIMKHIQEEKACYGFLDCQEKVSIGNVELLAVSEEYLKTFKEKGKYKEVDGLLKLCEQMNGEIKIITDKEAMKKLDSLGGIAGILRWKS
ncbi:MAG: mRNA surveillance protein pelota [Candidatus Woesearchaeota archaeon]